MLALAETNERLRTKKISLEKSMKSYISELRRLRDGFFDCGGTLTENEWLMIIVQLLTSHSE